MNALDYLRGVLDLPDPVARLADGYGIAASSRFANARLEAQVRALTRRIAQLESDDRRTQAVISELAERVEDLADLPPTRNPMQFNHGEAPR